MSSSSETLAAQLLKEAREELIRADSKSATLLAGSGVVVGVVLAGIVAGDFRPEQLDCWARVVWWAGCVAVAVGVGCLGAAIFPRLWHKSATGPVTYFGDVAALDDAAAVKSALSKQVADEDRTVQQLKAISDLVQKKYRYIQVGLASLALGFSACFLSAVLG